MPAVQQEIGPAAVEEPRQIRAAVEERDRERERQNLPAVAHHVVADRGFS